MTLVDLHTSLRTQNAGTDAQNEALTNALQDRLYLISQTDRILFRWPWIIGPNEEPHGEQIDQWIKRLTDRDDADSVIDTVTFLLNQATCPNEQVLLVPELLLAAAQGKVPTLAHASIQKLASEIRSSWPNELGFDTARGAVEFGLWLIDNG